MSQHRDFLISRIELHLDLATDRILEIKPSSVGPYECGALLSEIRAVTEYIAKLRDELIESDMEHASDRAALHAYEIGS